MTGFARHRIATGQPMPGLFIAKQRIPIGHAIDDIVLIATCSLDGEWEGRIEFLPLR